MIKLIRHNVAGINIITLQIVWRLRVAIFNPLRWRYLGLGASMSGAAVSVQIFFVTIVFMMRRP